MKVKTILLFILFATGNVFSAEAKTPAPEAGDRKLPRRHDRTFHRRHPGNTFFAKFTPEERAKVRELSRSGKREELRKYIGSLMYKYRPEELKKLDELGAKYRAAGNEKEKRVIKAQMRVLAEKLFRKRQEFTHNNILYTEKQLLQAKQALDRLKKRYEHQQKNQAKIIELRVEQMCLPPEKREKFRKRKPEKTGNAENRQIKHKK